MIQQTDETWVNIQKIGILLGILGALFSIGFTLYRYQQDKKKEQETAAQKLQTLQQTSSFAGPGSAHKKITVNTVI